ncbi:MAG: hypothetical protein ACR2NR_00330 [Solirubrobacteraceae bacterium]
MGTVQVDIDRELLQRLRERHPGKSDRELIERLAIIDVGMAVLRENPRPDADPEDVVLEESVRAVHEARAEME